MTGTPDGADSCDGCVQPAGTLRCPHCGHVSVETMPVDYCLFFYACRGCGMVLKPKYGDCCVFCSYGDRPCPPKQRDAATGD